MKIAFYSLTILGLTGLGFYLYLRYVSSTSPNTATNTNTTTDTTTQGNEFINTQIKEITTPIKIRPLNLTPLAPTTTLGTLTLQPSLTLPKIHITIPLKTVLATQTQANTFMARITKTAWPKSVKSNLKTAKLFSDGYYYTIPSGYDYSGFLVKVLLPANINGGTAFYGVNVYDKTWTLKVAAQYMQMVNGEYTSLPASTWQ